MISKSGMKDEKATHRLLVQFLKFGVVGVGNTAVSMATYYIVLWLNPNLYMLGSILGAILSIFHAFLWSNFYVFSQKGQTPKQFFCCLGKCYLSYGGTSALSSILLWIEVTFWHIDKLYAPVVNLIITIPLNFILNKLWVFGKKRSGT